MSAVAVLAAYVLGSVPFALLVSRARGVDLRSEGSGNLGATNAIRVLGPSLGIPVLLADVAKGFAAAAWLPGVVPGGEEWLPLACGAAATLGHVFPVFLRFRGGKGVATACGAFLALAPAGTGIAFAVFALVLFASRFVSLASMAAAATLPVALWATGAPRLVFAAGMGIGILVLVRHRANAARLASGTENRVRFGKSAR